MKKLLILVFIILPVLSVGFFASASSYTYNEVRNSYIYNSWGQSVAAPAAYEVIQIYNAADMGLEKNLKNPSDMFIANDGSVYIADSENNRILVLNNEFKLTKVIEELSINGEPTTLLNPKGIFLSKNNEIYIADTDNKRVIKSDMEGIVSDIYTKPDSELYPQDTEYKPLKVLADSASNVYVLAESIYHGIVLYSPEGNFEGFFGSNRVEATAKVILDYFWKRIMTPEQISRMARYVPVNYVNMCIDEKDFVYAASTGGQSRTGRLKKLNPSGINTLRTEKADNSIYGDKEIQYLFARASDTQMIDVCSDSDDFIFSLDSTRNRIFVYDQDSNLITIFGGEGNQKGSFRKAVSIDTYDGKVFVLDAVKGSITVFQTTTYGGHIRNAFTLYNAGLFEEAVGPWEEVIKLNGNLDLAFSGTGKALLKEGRLKEALDAFKDGYNRAWYSKTYKDYRKETVRDNFLIVFVVLIVLVAGTVVLIKRKKLAAALGITISDVSSGMKPYRYPFKVLFHPFEAFEDLKYRKVYSYRASLIILMIWVIAKIFERQLTGFAFNYNRSDEFNIFMTLGGTVFIFILWSAANWAICTLFDGEGSFKEIWVASSYALTPYILSVLISTFLSNYIIHEEGVFIGWLVYVGIVWSAMLMIGAIKSVHQYEISKTILSIVFTIAGIAISLFILIMFLSLVQQLVVFITSVFNEIILMFR
ncbi:hypothetical protein EOM86_00855 [Candidatus Nomurabacteria bacterium]|nr:hypothetical protein [Candidatus Nomurabacteria bacterium]